MSDLEVPLGDKRLLVDEFDRAWIDVYRELLHDKRLIISDFLPTAVMDSHSISYRMIADSNPVKRRVPLREIRRLEQAFAQLEREKANPKVEHARQVFLGNLRFPDPDQATTRNEYPCRIQGGRLILLWGYDYGPNGSLEPKDLLDRLRQKAFPPDWPPITYGISALTIAAVLLFAVAAIFWAFMDTTPPQFELAEITAADEIRVVFNEQMSDPAPAHVQAFEISDARTITKIVPNSDREYRIRFEPPLVDQEELNVSIHEVRDRAGNVARDIATIGPYTFSDTTGPQITVVREEEGSIFFEFNESVMLDNATVSLTAANGMVLSEPLTNVATKDRFVVRTLKPVAGLQPGDRYQVNFARLTDRSSAKNTPRPHLYAYKDQTPPKLLNAYYKSNGVVMIMRFNEAVQWPDGFEDSVSIADGTVLIHGAERGNTPQEILIYTDFVGSKAGRGKHLHLEVAESVLDLSGNKGQPVEDIASLADVDAKPHANLDVTDSTYDTEGGIVRLSLHLRVTSVPDRYPPLAVDSCEVHYGPKQTAVLSINVNDATKSTVSPASIGRSDAMEASCEIQIQPGSDLESDNLPPRTGDEQELLIRFPTSMIGVSGDNLNWDQIHIKSRSHGEIVQTHSEYVRVTPIRSQ